ncbi:small conductance mechanosensitive channel [Bacillus sp. 491mf]|uniref:mechanosensitive ion channel family protein n=1 Tax=Bacillus sp. 491mf TaxID=1761755 RepID=UPI0008EED3B9|nr:mechanosensitive ion channel domain-containing protein [Bacillus sp. 491mf]SFD41524.1 small conductance mechanosensitive channel [Bacillus sp. 491mf]
MDIQEILGEYVLNPEKLIKFGGIILKIVLILIVAKVIIRVASVGIEQIFKMSSKAPVRTNERREATLTKLCQNIIHYVVYFMVVMTILETVGIDIKALLAGVSVAGLAIGFGAQNLVKDIVTGFFIIFEDQFSVGDKVKINDIDGIIEEVGLRTTQLVAEDGEIYFIANSSIIKVANYSLGEKRKEIA